MRFTCGMCGTDTADDDTQCFVCGAIVLPRIPRAVGADALLKDLRPITDRRPSLTFAGEGRGVRPKESNR